MGTDKVEPILYSAGFTVGCAGYVICPAKSEWQITLVSLYGKPRLGLSQLIFTNIIS